MPWLAAAAPYIGLAMSGASAYGSAQGGKTAEINSKIAAIQDERDADAEQVAAQNIAAQERRKMRFLRSRAIAVAGASGAGVDDPTVENLITGIETEGEISALNALYSGDIEARALRMQGRAQRSRGTALRSSYDGQAFSTLASGALQYGSQIQTPTFFSKYGQPAAASSGMGSGTGFGPQAQNFARLPGVDEFG